MIVADRLRLWCAEWRQEVVRITARIRLWWRHSILHHNSQTITERLSLRSHITSTDAWFIDQLQLRERTHTRRNNHTI